MPNQHATERAVAIIGAGPAGLAAAAWLRREGFAPVLFEASAAIGGQWNTASPHSGVWPGMRTNTSRVLSAFSDLTHPPGTPVYPAEADMRAYLHRYAAMAGIEGSVRLSTTVERLTREPGGAGWRLQSRQGDTTRQERFARVVIATGRHTAPAIPPVPGLDGFTGPVGVAHSFAYRGAEAYRGRTVLVASCSISALEIASELALSGAARVLVASRRQRYVMQKLIAGVPADHLAFTRFAARAGAVLPQAALAKGLKAFVVGSSGNPEQVGAPRPAADIFAAGLTQSQSYLPLVAEGRIEPRPWMQQVAGDTIRFADGSETRVDGIVLGTGYRLSLPFLDDATTAALGLDEAHIDLFDHTVHPDLPGLAVLGMFDQAGPYLPVLELQARWQAYAWSGRTAMPDAAALRAGLAACRARRGAPQEVPMHAMAVLFASHAGVEPDPDRWPALRRALMFGPLSPAGFRLEGPDHLADAPARIMADAQMFGCQATPELTADEKARWSLLQSPTAPRAA